LAPSTFTDRVFRGLRHLVPELEESVSVLIAAESTARVYYRAFRAATQSLILRRVCDQILRDGPRHVEPQSDQLVRQQSRRGKVLLGLTRGLPRLLYGGTVVVVGNSHRAAVLGGGYRLGRWWSCCWLELAEAFRTVAPTGNPMAASAVLSSGPKPRRVQAFAV
jgi:hypothetical protein